MAATVEIKADTKQAENQFKSLRDSANDLGSEFKDMGKEAIAVGLALGGIAAVQDLLQKGIDATTAALSKTIEKSKEYTKTVAGTNQSLEKLQVAFGNTVLGGGNLEQMAGALNQIFSALTKRLEANADEIQGATLNAFASLIEAIGVGVRIGAVMINTVNALRLAFEGIKVAVAGVAAIIVDVFTVAMTGVTLVIRGIVEQVELFVEGIAALSAGIPGVGDKAQAMADAIDGISNRVGEATDAVQAMGTTLSESFIETGEESLATMADISEQMFEVEQTAVELEAGLGRVAETVRDGTAANFAHAESVGKVVEELNKWKEVQLELIRIQDEGALKQKAAQLDTITQTNEFAAEMISQFNQIAEAQAASAEEQAEADKESIKKRAAGFEAFGSAVGSTAQDIASGQKTATAAMGELAAAGLEAAATKGLAEGAILLFTPGMQANAVGMLAASAAALAVASGIRAQTGGGGGSASRPSAPSGAVSSGAAPPRRSGATQQTTNTVNNNFGVLIGTDERQVATAVATGFNNAQSFGMIGAT